MSGFQPPVIPVVQGDRYVILDSTGTCINIIVWDGVSPWSPPPGCTIELEATFLAAGGVDQ